MGDRDFHVTPPKFSVGDRVRVVNRAGEVVLQEGFVASADFLNFPHRATCVATGLGVLVPPSWAYGVTGRPRPVEESALRPIPPEQPAIARKREAEPEAADAL